MFKCVVAKLCNQRIEGNTFCLPFLLSALLSVFIVTQNSVYGGIIHVGMDSETDGAWRTSSVDKPLDADNDDIYGTDGWVWFGYHIIKDNNYPERQTYDTSWTEQDLPSYISAISPPLEGQHYNNAVMVDDPLNPGSEMYAESCGGTATSGHTITITRASSQAFRLTVIIPRHLGGYEEDIHVQTGTDYIDVHHVHPHTDLDYTAYQIFDIPGGLEDISLTFSDPVNGLTVSSGFAFDVVPEPASMTLLLLGSAALLRRRKTS